MSMKLFAEVQKLKEQVEGLSATLTATIAATEERLSALEAGKDKKQPRKHADKAH